MRGTSFLAIYSAIASSAALGVVAYDHFWRTSLSLDQLIANKVTTGLVSVEYQGRELVRISDSSVTDGGAIAVFNAGGEQALVATDGTIAIKGGEKSQELLPKLRGWALILGASKDSSTIAMKGEQNYEVVIEAGKTLDDPLAIRGGRIGLRSGESAAKVDSSGVKSAPPRNW